MGLLRYVTLQNELRSCVQRGLIFISCMLRAVDYNTSTGIDLVRFPLFCRFCSPLLNIPVYYDCAIGSKDHSGESHHGILSQTSHLQFTSCWLPDKIVSGKMDLPGCHDERGIRDLYRCRHSSIWYQHPRSSDSCTTGSKVGGCEGYSC
jgi:hypothetical protein